MKARLIKKVEDELMVLEKELKTELPQEIKRAVALGDLRENAEYHSALERQRFLHSRIAQIMQKLSEISLVRIDQVPKDRVGLGSKFRVLDTTDDKEIEFEIVMEGMGNPGDGLISISSPLARGFLNKQPGDEVTINVPSGKKTYEILELRTLHDREQAGDA